MIKGESEKLMVSFSGGRTSAFMTEKILQLIPKKRLTICFANTGKENEATLAFVNQCDIRWGGIVNWLEYDPLQHFRITNFQSASRNGEPYSAIINRRRYLPNVVARFCTQELKIRPIKWFMINQGHKSWTNVVGIRYDEPRRWSKTNHIADRERWDIWLPLVDWRVTKEQVLQYWRSMPFDLQLLDHQGNCDLCFLKGKHKLMRILTEEPQKADWWMEQEKLTGGTFHKGYSYARLKELIEKSPELFSREDPDIECFCNLD